MACTESVMLSWGGRGPTVLQVVEGKVPEVGGEVRQSQEPPGQRVPEESGAGTLWEQPVLDDLLEAREVLSTSVVTPGTGEGFRMGGVTSSVVCTILSTEEKYASHRNWVCCWKASTRSGWMQRTAEGICAGRGELVSHLVPPQPPSRVACLCDPHAILRATPRPRMLCHPSAAALPPPLPGAASSPGPPKDLGFGFGELLNTSPR